MLQLQSTHTHRNKPHPPTWQLLVRVQRSVIYLLIAGELSRFPTSSVYHLHGRVGLGVLEGDPPLGLLDNIRAQAQAHEWVLREQQK